MACRVVAAACAQAGHSHFRLAPQLLVLVRHHAPRALPVRGLTTKATTGPTVAELLARKRLSLNDYLIFEDEPLATGLRRLSDLNISSLMVVSRLPPNGSASGTYGSVLGMVTAHDLMRTMSRQPDMAGALGLHVNAAMTPASKLVHIHPSDPVAQAAATMAELHVTHLPAVADGKVHGIVTLGDVADMLSRRGGKEAAVSIVAHRGISEGTRVELRGASGGTAVAGASAADAAAGTGHVKPLHAAPGSSRGSFGSGPGGPGGSFGSGPGGGGSGGGGPDYIERLPLHMRTGVAATPRAPKRGVEKPSEDAYFTLHVAWPRRDGEGSGDGAAASGHKQQSFTPITYLGVADGVGSWWERGVDPRLYARALMEECARAVWRSAHERDDPPSPLDVLTEAWKRVAEAGVVGSATAAVVSLDPVRRQLLMHGVGDCGVILLRDTDVHRVGSLLRGGTAAGIRPGFRVSARATQQLRGFNMPYQLGYSPDPSHGVFQHPSDGETLVLPVRAEDIVLAGSDGLFDNMDETDILAEVEAWDAKDLPRRQAERAQALAAGPTAAVISETSARRLPRVLDGTSVGAEQLALALTRKAREYSVDKMRDGPFARLAKENDILWTHGGRPDDVTVLVARISDKGPEEVGAQAAGATSAAAPGGKAGGGGSGCPAPLPALLEPRLKDLVPSDGSCGIRMQ